jgi:hypothetical protein
MRRDNIHRLSSNGSLQGRRYWHCSRQRQDWLSPGRCQQWSRSRLHLPGISGRGSHKKDGVFYAYGGGIKRGFKAPNAEIYDLVPTVLRIRSMNLLFPHEFDGRVLEEVFVESQRNQSEPGAVENRNEGGLARRKLKKLLEV